MGARMRPRPLLEIVMAAGIIVPLWFSMIIVAMLFLSGAILVGNAEGDPMMMSVGVMALIVSGICVGKLF